MTLQWQAPLLGGALIGAAVVLLAWKPGQVAGISGIFSRLLRGQSGPAGWRSLFLAGLLLPGALRAGSESTQFAGGFGWLAIAGLLVGVGTRLGSGCTSGHGVCGLARGSRRSLAATVTFMAFAMITVYVVRHVIGAG
jgi:hypothetical protein